MTIVATGGDRAPRAVAGPGLRGARPSAFLIAAGLVGSMVVMFWLQFAYVQQVGRYQQDLSALLDNNVRTVFQLRREVLRLHLELSMGEPAADLVFHRAFVRQRLSEASDSERYFVDDADTVEYSETLDGITAIWAAVEPTLQRLIDGDATASVADVMSELERMERSADGLASWSEAARRKSVGEATGALSDLVHEIRVMMVALLVVFLASTAAFVAGVRGLVEARRAQQRFAEETVALNAQLSLLSEVAERTGNGVLITDGRGVVQWVNDAYCSLVCRTREELCGRQAEQPSGVEYRDLTEAVRAGAASADRGYVTEFGLERSDGRVVWAAVELRAIPDGNGGTRNFVAMVTDLTRRREVEEQLRASARDAEEAANAKSAFLAAMSHEIRTPLNGMLGLNELLLATPLDPHQRDLAQNTQASGEVLLALVSDILAFSAFGDGLIEIEQRPIELGEIVRSTVTTLHLQASKGRVTVVEQVDPALSGLHIGDPSRLRQVVFNLLSNSIKFSPGGRVVVGLVRVGGDDDADDIVIEVSDDGVGIPADRIVGIFEPFVQADPDVRQKFGGTGLGLAICRKLLEAMGGTVALESVEGEGTTARVALRLPRCAQANAATGDAAPSSVPSLRVMLVEDDPVNEKVATLMLLRAGIAPVVTRNGEAAVAAALSDDFDLVLMDINLPILDGVEATMRISEGVDPMRRPRIVALTANVFADDCRRMFDAGVAGVLSKPFRYHELLAVLEETAAGIIDATLAGDVGAAR